MRIVPGPSALNSRTLRTASRCRVLLSLAAVPGVARSPPNIRSNTTRGLISIGSGWVGEAQLIVLM
jgi:hypothetical protein